MSKEKAERRGFWWWVSAILTPVGWVGGPIAIANLLSGAIRWHGPIGFAVAYWDEQISQPFSVALTWLLSWIRIPPPPDVVTDYLVLGIMWTSLNYRSFALERLNVHPFRQPLKLAFLAIKLVFTWPWHVLRGIALLLVVLAVRILVPREAREQHPPKARIVQPILLSLAPFAIFLVLWAVNTFIPATA